MKVKNLWESKGSEVISINAGNSVEDAIHLMHKKKISALMVTEDDRTIGIFTERDVVRCYISKEARRFREIPVKEAMTSNLIVAELNDDLNNIMSVMVDKNIRHLPIIEGGKVIGMLSIRDIVQTQVNKLSAEIHYLKDYISGI